MKRLLSLLTLFSLLLPMAARAESESLNVAGKRTVLVAKAAAYGAGGGLVVGLASQVFKKKAKNIFLFGSLGLYAGILVGIYVISSSHGPSTYEGPDTYEDFGDFSLRYAPMKSSGLANAERKFGAGGVSASFVHLNF